MSIKSKNIIGLGTIERKQPGVYCTKNSIMNAAAYFHVKL